MNTATQTLYSPLTVATAPKASKPALEKIQKTYGFIPNLMATFANSPAVLLGYLAMDGVFEKGTFSPVERQLILLAASEENKCNYCSAAHSTIAKRFLHAPAETITAVREGKPLADKKQNALVNLVREIVGERGFASPTAVDAFLEAGYQRPQVMELLLGVALKTVSNYLDHLSPTTIDQAFAAEAR
jgi:AhpD family alkylhydroperoxidase